MADVDKEYFARKTTRMREEAASVASYDDSLVSAPFVKLLSIMMTARGLTQDVDHGPATEEEKARAVRKIARLALAWLADQEFTSSKASSP